MGTPDSEELGGWLALASAEGKLKSMRFLLRLGANVNHRSEDGESPFSWACARNQLASAKLLLQFGADVNAPLSSGLTPLDCAVCWASPEFRMWLKGAGGRRSTTYDEWPWPPTPNEIQ
ncbi:MAG: ankyrin repeat domain-containing protein [Verrucomicrobiales bacterium]